MKCPGCGRSLWLVRRQCPFCKADLKPPAKTARPAVETIGDMLDRGVGVRPLAPSDLSDEFQVKLLALCAANPNIADLWLAWTQAPDGTPELLASLRLDRPNERTVFGFMHQADALGGPRFAVSIPNAIPTAEPFYSRSEHPPSAPAPDPDDEASRVPLPERRGQLMVLRCRTPAEADLVIQELAREDIMGVLPQEEIERYRRSGGGYVEIQISAAAYQSASELQKVVEFHHQVVRADQPLPFGGRVVAFVLGISICPGLLVFLVVCNNYSARGYQRMARQALLYCLCGLALALAVWIWAFGHS